jgi:hypothetical protein
MPSYKTHSIHGEVILPQIDKRIDIDVESLKTFCLGFDTLMLCDYEFFKKLHNYKTRRYFETILNYIKSNKLQDNNEVMAFLYGHLDHFILDLTVHPLIYYMTGDKEQEFKFNYHALVEMWMDDYVMKKHHIDEKQYYHKLSVESVDLKELINYIYLKLYKKTKMVLKYNIGINSISMFDNLVRHNAMMIAPIICKMINSGDIVYLDDIDRVLPYLNLEHDIWYNPETGEEYTKSFDDLWDESIETSKEVIYDINNFLYDDKPLNNRIITGDLSANTGLPCKVKQKLKYIKKY